MKKIFMKKTNKKVNLKRILSSVLTTTMLFSLAGCGQSGTQTVAGEQKEYVYVPEYIELNNEEEQYYSNIQMVGNDLVYSYYVYDEEKMTGTEYICKKDIIAGGDVQEISLSLEEDQSTSQFVMDAEGNIYTSVHEYPLDAGPETEPKMYLAKFDASGNVVFMQDITEILNSDENNSYIQNIALDKEGRIYAQASELIRLFDAEGNYQGDVKLSGDGWLGAMGVGKDGKMYVSYYDYSGANSSECVAEVDFAGKKLGTTYADFPNNNGQSLSVGINKDFLVNTGEGLVEYDCATQTYEEVLNWLDCDINGNYVEQVAVTEDGKLLAVINSWGQNSTMELAILNKVKASEVPAKEVITIGALYSQQNLTAAAVEFNKKNDKYRVTIKDYMDTNSFSDTAYDDAMTNLNNDIVSGTNSPDILDFTNLNMEQLLQKGAVEDLTPYLEASTTLKKEDFIPSIIDAYTVDGVLATIPKTFGLMTVSGKTSEVGSEMGWSMEEIMEYAAAHPDAALFDYATKMQMLYYCMMFNDAEFVDWTTGECKFNSPEFRAIMEFVNEFPDDYDWSEEEESTPVKLQEGKVLLNTEGIYEVRDIQLAEAMFDEPVTYIGFPTIDGTPGIALQASEMYGIASKSEHKEGAWEFLEFYMTYEDDVFGGYGFSTHTATLEKYIEESLKEGYQLDENGNIMYDENGEPIITGSFGIGYGDWEYDYHPVTEEELATFREVLAVARPVSNTNEKIMEIINEEGAAYFSGQKSVDDVINVIQSRVQIYVSENS